MQGIASFNDTLSFAEIVLNKINNPIDDQQTKTSNNFISVEQSSLPTVRLQSYGVKEETLTMEKSVDAR